MAYRAHGLSSVLPTRLLFTQRLDNIADTWYDDKKIIPSTNNITFRIPEYTGIRDGDR